MTQSYEDDGSEKQDMDASGPIRSSTRAVCSHCDCKGSSDCAEYKGTLGSVEGASPAVQRLILWCKITKPISSQFFFGIFSDADLPVTVLYFLDFVK